LTYELHDPSGSVLARRDQPVTSTSDTEPALAATVDLLYRSYSAEGFYLMEHLLLRPQHIGDLLLSLPIGFPAADPDPYSYKISLVFPSGYARDFSLDRRTAPTTPTTPDRFRDLELRNHAERMIMQACPAHLVPIVYWVDQALPGTLPPLPNACFETFEQRYFDWLDTVLIPGAPAAAVDAARAAMVETMNAIANDTP
jgi:hypothetical protein